MGCDTLVALAPATQDRVTPSRTSDGSVGTAGSRRWEKSSPGAIPADARDQSAPSVMRFEIAAPSSTARAAHVRPLVSSTHAPEGSATRNDDQYGSSACSSQRPPWPCSSSSEVITSSASSADRPRSRPSRTRSIPVSAAGASRGSSVVKIRSLPIATRCSFTPCSKPHIQAGREPTTAHAPASAISRCVVRSDPPAGRDV